MTTQTKKRLVIGAGLFLIIIGVLITIFLVLGTRQTSDSETQNEHTISNPVDTIETKTYTNEHLPGFSIQYPSNWIFKIKDFKESDTLSIKSNYFPSCHEDCMGFKLEKNNVILEIAFDAVLDGSNHVQCSNSANVDRLKNGWYRITDSTETFYTQTIQFDVEQNPNILNEFTSSNGDWTNTKAPYEFCIFGHGQFLKEQSSVRLVEGSKVWILVENPRIIGNPDSDEQQEIDEIIESIKLM